MKSLLVAVLTLLSPFANCEDKVIVQFSDDDLKVFGSDLPLIVEVERKEADIVVRLINNSKKHLSITKSPISMSSSSESADGEMLSEAGVAGLAHPKELLDHVVLQPQLPDPKMRPLSSLMVMRFPISNDKASIFNFEYSYSGYFPMLDKYTTFRVIGRLQMKPDPKE